MESNVQNNFLQINTWGDPVEVVSLQKEIITVNELQQNDLLVKMSKACIHPSDIATVNGIYPWSYSVKNNIIPTKFGIEGVGQVIKKGKDVTQFEIGEKIIPRFSQGDFKVFSQYVICKSGHKIPQNLPDTIASQLLVNPHTAIGLIDAFGLCKEEPKGWLVQNAANSTVGRMVHAIAKDRGIKSLAIVRKEDGIETCKDNGADKVIVVGNINNSDEYAKAILEATDGQGILYGIECVGGEAALGMWKAMAQNGTLLVYGALTGKIFNIEGLPNPKNITSYFYLVLSLFKKPQEEQKALVDYLGRLIDQGKITLPVEKEFSLEDHKQAFEYQVRFEKSRTGKILLKID